ncbi:MAG: hypothetical protein K2H85_04585, partial [Allobaculum sp.]|nr:hypothetical protein [Allobaculum sp.]
MTGNATVLTVQAIEVITLDDENTQVVYKLENDKPVFLKVQLKNADGEWEDLPFDDFDIDADSFKAATSLEDATVEITSNSDLYVATNQAVPAILDDTVQDDATPLTAENTQVVYTKAADGTLTPSAIQVKDADGNWKDLPNALDSFKITGDPATGKVSLALNDGATAPEGYSVDGTIADVPAKLPDDNQDSKYAIVSITIDGTTITDTSVLANFDLTNVKDGKGDLTYSASATPTFQAQYKIVGENNTITVTATEEQAQAAIMTEANSTSPESVLSKDKAPVALAYAYDTDANVTGDQMTVKVYKESLMNRLYNPNSGEHFYTKDNHEKDVLVELGWQYEGIGWVAPTGPVAQAPVYRLYNPNAGDHHYTKDANEKDTLVRVGWSFEGVGWYSAA